MVVSNALDLKPPSINYMQQQTISTDKNSFAIQLRQNTELKTIEESKFNEFIESVKLAVDVNSKINTVQWKYEISSTLGVLKVLFVEAKIDSTNINFAIKGAQINQEIPEVYKSEEQCVPGTRLSCSRGSNCHVVSFRDCRNVNVKRGITPDEITQVVNSLNSQIPEVVKEFTK